LARFLALDWDHQQLLVVAATVGRGGIRIQQAAVWKEKPGGNPVDAERLGRLLRDRLKEARIAPAPVLACVGRDRVIVKEVRYPTVPAAEEPAIVRFQTVKELTDPPDEVVIDFIPPEDVSAGGERRTWAFVVRREVLAGYQALCQTAGLKLQGLTPRPFGTVACLRHVAGTTVLTPLPEPADAAVAVLTLSEQGAEFCILRGERLLLARSFPAGNGVAGEVRRNLIVHAGQSTQDPVRTVYVAGTGEHGALRERLHQMLEIPVHLLDPFGGAERPELPSSDRGIFAGAVGLVYAYADKGRLPVNFAQPKQPSRSRDPNKRRLIAAAIAAAVLLVGTSSVCYSMLAAKDRQLDELAQNNFDLDRQLKPIEEDASRIKALDEWSQTQIAWLDELYDLTERFPDTNAIRVTELNGQVESSLRPGKDKHSAKMSLKGIMGSDRRELDKLINRLVQEPNYKTGILEVKRNMGVDVARFRQEFKTSIDIDKRPPNQYTRQLPAPVSEEDASDNPARGPRPAARPRGPNGKGRP
jgi:Tfp pilus assembly PilM family ATPase